MNPVIEEPASKPRSEAVFGEAEERRLTHLLSQWRTEVGLNAGEERELALLLKALLTLRASDVLEAETFLRLVQPFAGAAQLCDDEKRGLIRKVKPLLKVRDLTSEEKQELAELFEAHRMKLWSKLRRSIGARLESKFEPEEVLSEAYIRAETRWFDRPRDPAKAYVWLYGIVHDQYCDMLRRVNALKRGGERIQVRIPDNSAAEIALQFWQSQTGPSTNAARKEFVERVRGFLERSLSATDLEIFMMRVFDRLEFAEVVAEMERRAGDGESAAHYQEILAELEARSRADGGDDQDLASRRTEAIRKRFRRAVTKLTTALLAEFPELLDILPVLRQNNA